MHRTCTSSASHPAPWIVVKFGGTSIGDAARWPKIEEILRRHLATGHQVLMVCSAASGVTDQLVAIVATLDQQGDPGDQLAWLGRRHHALIAALGIEGDAAVLGAIAALAAAVATCPRPTSPRDRAALLAHGELISSQIATAWLARRGLAVACADARHLLAAESGADRAERYLSARCTPVRRPQAIARLARLDVPVVVTQGFIARAADGATVLLGRGGSDASAAYLASAIGADAVELWSDVPGMFTADPRTLPEARLLRRLSFAEAEALGALGAKVVHPRTIEPLARHRIPIRLGWTACPEIAGTRIGAGRAPRGAKAIASRRGLALLSMWRPSSWQPVGFMAEVAARFHRRGLSMDLVATSPSEIRATVDLLAFPSARDELELLLADLSEVCRPRLLSRVACVSVVGAGVGPRFLGASRGGDAFAGAVIHMVGHAGDGSHVSVVVDEAAADDLVRAAHRHLIADLDDDSVFGPRWDSFPAVAAAAPEVAAGAAGRSLPEVARCATA